MEHLPTENKPPDPVDRHTLCLPIHSKKTIVHAGDEGFSEELRRNFHTTETNANERLVKLKTKLRTASTEEFWSLLMVEMCAITDSQYGFVAKRILVDDQSAAVEMPAIGEEGSCLMGVAFYFNDGHGTEKMFRDYEYSAYGAPCGSMRHDKVFLLTERLSEFFPNNPNMLPFPAEAYLGIPLFAEEKCFAHFGVMWSPEGVSRRKLSWGYLEMLLHS